MKIKKYIFRTIILCCILLTSTAVYASEDAGKAIDTYKSFLKEGLQTNKYPFYSQKNSSIDNTNNARGDLSFEILDFNSDGIPELSLRTSFPCIDYVLTYDSGIIKEVTYAKYNEIYKMKGDSEIFLRYVKGYKGLDTWRFIKINKELFAKNTLNGVEDPLFGRTYCVTKYYDYIDVGEDYFYAAEYIRPDNYNYGYEDREISKSEYESLLAKYGISSDMDFYERNYHDLTLENIEKYCVYDHVEPISDPTPIKKPGKTAINKIGNVKKGIYIKWTKATNADKYVVERGNGSGWKQIATTTSCAYTDKAANVNGKQYRYRVIPYAGKTKGTTSSASGYYCLSYPKKITAKNTGKKKITVTWTKNEKGSGYEILYKTDDESKTATINKNTTEKKVIKKLTVGKTYTIYVRAFKTVSGKKYYSAYGKVKTCKVEK